MSRNESSKTFRHQTDHQLVHDATPAESCFRSSVARKGWFPCDRRRLILQTIADRRSQTIAKRAVSIQSQTIANDCRADCSHTFRSAEISNVHARCVRGKIAANNMADIEGKILLQANLFLLLVLKWRHRQLQNRRKHRFWVRKIFMKRRELRAFHPMVIDRRSIWSQDRRRSQNFLRSAIVCDHMKTSLKFQLLKNFNV